MRRATGRATTKARATRRTRRTTQAPKPKVLMVRVKKKRKPGRPVGSKDSFPRSAKATFRAICEEIQDENGHTIKAAMLEGIRGGPAYADKFLKLFRDSIDGPPAVTSNINAHFREDELAAAGKQLTRKMDALFRAAMGHDGSSANATGVRGDDTPSDARGDAESRAGDLVSHRDAAGLGGTETVNGRRGEAES